MEEEVMMIGDAQATITEVPPAQEGQNPRLRIQFKWIGPGGKETFATISGSGRDMTEQLIDLGNEATKRASSIIETMVKEVIVKKRAEALADEPTDPKPDPDAKDEPANIDEIEDPQKLIEIALAVGALEGNPPDGTTVEDLRGLIRAAQEKGPGGDDDTEKKF